MVERRPIVLKDGELQQLPIGDTLPGSSVVASDPGWIELPLVAPWVDFSVPQFDTAKYRKDVAGVVHLSGLVKDGALNGVIATLPVGYRPITQLLFAVEAQDLHGRMDVNVLGEIRLVSGLTGYVSLASISFPTADSVNITGIKGDDGLDGVSGGIGPIQDETTNRAKTTVYQNLEAEPLMVWIQHDNNDDGTLSTWELQKSVDNSTWVTVGRTHTTNDDNDGNVYGMIPANYYYRFAAVTGNNTVMNVTSWYEQLQVLVEGVPGPVGPAGPVGLPIGGTTGQVLTKDTDLDGEASWQDSAGGGGGGDLVVQSRQSFTTIADQTTFTVNPYTPGNLDVFLNGIHLNAADFVATSGTTVVLAKAALVGSICEVISVETVAVAELPDPKMNMVKVVDSVGKTYSTTWAVGMVLPNLVKSSGNPVMISVSVPLRNDHSSWGGSFNRLEYSLDDGVNWVSLGDTGYDGPMDSSGDSIGIWGFTQIIDLAAIVSATGVRFRMQHRSYEGTLTVLTSSGVGVGVGYTIGYSHMSALEIKV